MVGALYEAVEIVLRAERRLGEVLAGMELRGGDRKSNSHIVSLKELGITWMQSSRWQAESRVDENDFESWLASSRESEKVPTSGNAKETKAEGQF